MYTTNYAPPLPFSAQQVQAPYLQLTLQNPPYVPAVQAMMPELQQMVPLISSMCAIEIQQKSQLNPLRLFMFNQYAFNSYANQEFTALIAAVTDFLAVHLLKRTYVNAEQGVQDAVPKMCEMLAAMNLRQFPALEQFCDAGLVQVARGLIATFDQVAAEISNVKRQFSQPQPYGYTQNTYAGPPQARMGGPGMQYGNYGAAQPWSPPQPQPRPSMGNVSLTSRFGGDSNTTLQSGTSQSVKDSRYDNTVLQQPAALRKPMTAATPAQEEKMLDIPPEPEVKEIPASQVKWKPSERFPYYPAYNPATHELYFKIGGDGQMQPSLKKRKEPVDYNAHATSTFGPKPRNLNLEHNAKILERIGAGVEAINNEEPVNIKEGTDEPPEIQTVLTRPDWFAETSVASAWLLGSLERLAARNAEGKAPEVFRCFSVVADAVVGVENETDYVRGFGSCASYSELHTKLVAAYDKVSPELWAVANRRMTQTINRIIRQSLAIPVAAMIESFEEDWPALQEHIRRHYGDTAAEALLRNQKDHIRRVFGVMEAETAQAITEGVLDPAEYIERGVEVPKITYVSSNYSFTFLDCRSHELALELNKDCGSAIIEQLTPQMRQLLEGLFRDTEGAEIERHLIRTIDGRVLEASRGYISEDFFTLTLIE